MGSMEMREDIALVTEKKAELAAVLRQAITIIRGGNVNPTGGGGGGGVPPPPARGGGAGGTAARSKVVAECNFDYDAQQVRLSSVYVIPY